MSDTNTRQPQDKVLLTIDERILAIEAELKDSQRGAPGTTLSRVLKEKEGFEWALALGGLMLPKTFFRGPSIEDVVSQGEAAIADMKTRGMNRLPNDWDTLNETLTVSASARRKKGGTRGFAAFDDPGHIGSAVKPAKVSRKKVNKGG